MNADILYEDNHLIVLNKPTGILVQADETGDECLADSIKNYIKQVKNKPGDAYLGVIHRLDRPASGVVCFAKTSKALERMNKLFATRKISKQYYAIVEAKPPKEEGRLVHHIVKDSAKNRVHVHVKPKSGTKEAILDYKLQGRIGGQYLLSIELHTGRAHQIRAQLAKIGCPIKGDRKYGFIKGNKDKSICLHAKNLSFEHPVKKEPLSVSAPIPMTSAWQAFWDF